MSGFSPFWFGGDPTKQSIWNLWVNQGKWEGEQVSAFTYAATTLVDLLPCLSFWCATFSRFRFVGDYERNHLELGDILRRRGRERGGDQVSACPSAHHKSSHTWFFLLSLTLGQPRSSPGDFCSIYRWGKITGSHQASNLLLFFWCQISSPRFILILFRFLTNF